MGRAVTYGAVVLVACLAGPAHADDARPAILVPASSDKAVVTVHMAGVDKKPEPNDIEAGALVNATNPDLKIVPRVTVTAVSGRDKDWDLTIAVDQLVPFGDSTVPLLYRGEQKQTLRFFKAGLVAKPATESGFSVRQGFPLTVVLENPTAFEYANVRARLRFHDAEVCQAAGDKPGAAAGKCDDPTQWTSFPVPKYSPVTLRMIPAREWFRDPQTGFPRGAKRKGLLSLMFQGDVAGGAGARSYQQDIPVEIQFEPSTASIGVSLGRVAGWLLVGALCALVLRVTIPNYRRNTQLKEQLSAAAKATRAISDDVESMLRVLLRVERLALDQLRRSAWVSGPGYPEVAQRVEQGLATLQRKIVYTRRLDAAMGRRSILVAENPSPTRLTAIDAQLQMASDALKRDQLGDQDWVFVQQRLEASDKLLGEPTQEEEDAFDALLAQRWKSIRDFFGLEGRRLKVPEALKGMEACFPSPEALPEQNDVDGSRWVKTVGPVRADLTLTALGLVRDFSFLVPPGGSQHQWKDVKEHLTTFLARPTIGNLAAARVVLSELAEPVNTRMLEDALRAGEADIELDPQFVVPNEKTRLTVRFRSVWLNTAAARRYIVCEWAFEDQHSTRRWRERVARRQARRMDRAAKDDANRAEHATPYRERGWEIYHYFEQDVAESRIVVRFYNSSNGNQVSAEPPESKHPSRPLTYERTVRPAEGSAATRERQERRNILWPEALQLGAALLVPLAALAVTQTGEGTSGRWWDLVGIGFGSEMIRNILTGSPSATTPASPAHQ